MGNSNYRIASRMARRLTLEDLNHIQGIVNDYLKTHAFVTNQILRKIAKVTYDQAAVFFGEMLKRKFLKRIGKGSGTRYITKRNVKN